MFSLSTTFDRRDFTRLLVERFRVPVERIEAFFDAAREMNFYDDQATTTGQLFERFFPARPDVVRLLMEPITYANGSTLEDPALSYGIVFSNFMSQGVYTFRCGTDALIEAMRRQLQQSGVDVRTRCPVEKIYTAQPAAGGRRIEAVAVAGRRVGARAVISNANLLGTIWDLVGGEHFDRDFLGEARAVRLNNSSTQVYLGLKPDAPLQPGQCGELLFSSTAPAFRTDLLLSRDPTSRTYSFYYPSTRLGLSRCAIVASTNANYADWAGMSKEDYAVGQAGADRGHAGRAGEIRAGPSGPARPRRGGHAADLRALHAAPRRRQFRHEVRGPGRQPRPAPPDRRPLPCRQRRHHHVRLAGRGQLRGDRGERRGCVSDGGEIGDSHRFFPSDPGTGDGPTLLQPENLLRGVAEDRAAGIDAGPAAHGDRDLLDEHAQAVDRLAAAADSLVQEPAMPLGWTAARHAWEAASRPWGRAGRIRNTGSSVKR